jgi:uncharacterized membrane protein
MTPQRGSTDTDETADAAPLARLRDELLEYLGAVGKHAVSKATDKLTDIAEGKLAHDGGGALAETAARAVKGENPVKALAAEKAKDTKDKVVGKAKEAVGADGGGSKPGDLKAINIIEHVDIGRPLRVVYDHFTQFEEFGGFMNGVSNVTRDPEDETKTTWKVRVWPSSRSYDATVSEQVPDQRIVWSSEGSKGTTSGAVSFHVLDDELTRVTVVVEYYPSGFVEKTGNIWRAQGRRLRLDLKHFQRYVTLQTEEAEGWRGEIRDGEVVRSHEEAMEEEEGEEDEGEEDEGDEEEDEEEEGEEEEDEEEEDDGRRRGGRRR